MGGPSPGGSPTFGHTDPPAAGYLQPARIVEVPNALVTPFRQLDGKSRRKVRTQGAVHTADGRLVTESQRIGGISGDHVVADDPPIAESAPQETLRGTWLYAGNWMAHFGHFLTETLTNLWPREERVDGVLAHPFIWRNATPTDDQLTLFHAAGMRTEPLIVDVCLRVERLLVPTRPFVPNAVAGPAAVAAWDAVAATVPTVTSGRVFLSRATFHAQHLVAKGAAHQRSLVNEEGLDDLMRAHGFTVVAPEELGVLEQVELVAGASHIAGVSGTALHLSAFAGRGTKVLELGDARSPQGLPNQHVISAVRGHAYAALSAADPPSNPNERSAFDLDRVRAGLEHLGLQGTDRWSRLRRSLLPSR